MENKDLEKLTHFKVGDKKYKKIDYCLTCKLIWGKPKGSKTTERFSIGDVTDYKIDNSWKYGE